jgi:hypothetical protein
LAQALPSHRLTRIAAAQMYQKVQCLVILATLALEK